MIFIHISTYSPVYGHIVLGLRVAALFPLRSSLKWATGKSKWVLTGGIPAASSTEPQLTCWSQQWANIHPCWRNHSDFSVVDLRGCSYDLQGFWGTTVACLDHVSWRHKEVWFFFCFVFKYVLFNRENICSGFWLNFSFKFQENAWIYFFLICTLITTYTFRGFEGEQMQTFTLYNPVMLGKNWENYCLIILKSLFNLNELT